MGIKGSEAVALRGMRQHARNGFDTVFSAVL